MCNLNFRQLEGEADSWKSLIVQLTEENNQLKNRLAETLRNNISQRMLVELENFQTCFINIDELIYLLRRDIAECDNLLQKKISGDSIVVDEIIVLWKELNHSIKTTEIKFWKLKTDFNKYLQQNSISRQTG